MNNENIINIINNLNEFYCLEEINQFSVTDLEKLNEINPKHNIMVIYFLNGKERQNIEKLDDLKKIYSFIQICYKQRNINILIYKKTNNNYKSNEILLKINNMHCLRGGIRFNLNIEEFPITNYFLEEQKNSYNEIIYDRIFLMKNIYETETKIILNNSLSNANQINNKICQNNSNFNNINNNLNNLNNQGFNNIFNMNINNNNNSNNINFNSQQIIKEDKNKDLEKLLNEEKNKNQKLNNRINELEVSLNEKNNTIEDLNRKIKNLEELLNNKAEELNKIINKSYPTCQKELNEIINNKNTEIEELKSQLKRYPFQLLPEEKMMSIIFCSINQEIHYSVICKNTDLFVNIELKVYENYPQYRYNENFFTVNGNKINKYLNLEQNKIKNNDIILLNSYSKSELFN